MIQILLLTICCLVGAIAAGALVLWVRFAQRNRMSLMQVLEHLIAGQDAGNDLYHKLTVKTYNVGIHWYVGITLADCDYIQAGPYSSRRHAMDQADKWVLAWNAVTGVTNEDVDRILDRVFRDSGGTNCS